MRIAAVGEADVNPAYFAGGYIPELIVSEAYAEKLMGETFTELVDVVYEEPFSEETEKAVKAVFAGESAVSTYSRLDRYHEMKISENQVKVLGLPLSFLAFQAMNVYFISFSIPWSGNLILFGCAFLVCVTAPVIIYDRTQNASVIERLRDKKCL